MGKVRKRNVVSHVCYHRALATGNFGGISFHILGENIPVCTGMVLYEISVL